MFWWMVFNYMRKNFTKKINFLLNLTSQINFNNWISCQWKNFPCYIFLYFRESNLGPLGFLSQSQQVPKPNCLYKIGFQVHALHCLLAWYLDFMHLLIKNLKKIMFYKILFNNLESHVFTYFLYFWYVYLVYLLFYIHSSH